MGIFRSTDSKRVRDSRRRTDAPSSNDRVRRGVRGNEHVQGHMHVHIKGRVQSFIGGRVSAFILRVRQPTYTHNPYLSWWDCTPEFLKIIQDAHFQCVVFVFVHAVELHYRPVDSSEHGPVQIHD